MLGAAGSAWVPASSGAASAAARRRLPARRAGSEVFLADSGPKARQVVEAYKKLVGEKDEKVAAEVIQALDPEQRVTLKRLIEAKGGAGREITTTDPEMGDLPERLFKKLQMLKTDEEVIAWRRRIDPKMAQEVQELIEVHQAELADKEAALEHADEAEAQQAWEYFKKQFPQPAENGRYFTTPVREADIKYRFRRLREALDVDAAVVVQIAGKDATPFVTDPDFIRRTWKAILSACDGDKQDALDSLVLKHPGVLIAKGEKIKDQLTQARITASAIDAASGLKNVFNVFR
uniref:Uncharacterized protein n=1 Tax=Zooxanthella nutricula TaxID=1333877 RepID=A0A7S2L937_9DINO